MVISTQEFFLFTQELFHFTEEILPVQPKKLRTPYSRNLRVPINKERMRAEYAMRRVVTRFAIRGFHHRTASVPRSVSTRPATSVLATQINYRGAAVEVSK